MIDTVSRELAAKSRSRIPARLRSKYEPDDLVQDVFVRACTANGRFSDRTEGEVRSYLDRTLTTVILDLVHHFDRGKREVARECSLEAADDDSTGGPGRWLAADQSSPSTRASRNELLAWLADALATLPAEQRRAVELHHLQGQSLAATAQAMGKTHQAVAGLLRRALAAMRDRLGDRAE